MSIKPERCGSKGFVKFFTSDLASPSEHTNNIPAPIKTYLPAPMRPTPVKSEQVRSISNFAKKEGSSAGPAESRQPPSEPHRILLFPAPPGCGPQRPAARSGSENHYSSPPLRIPEAVLKNSYHAPALPPRRPRASRLPLWKALISLPPPSEQPYDIEKRRGIGSVLDAGEAGARRVSPACGAGESNLRAHPPALASYLWLDPSRRRRSSSL